MTEKTWFITGASRGFGREWAEAALDRGDRVAATARNVESLKDLEERYSAQVLALQLDVTSREQAVAAVAAAHAHFGRLDVIVNNAGYGLFGMVEEIGEEQARAQMETNFFGTLWVTQAAIPFLRDQGRGHIVQVSSIGGVFSLPGLGIYHASKWAVEGFTASLAMELKGFGIHTTLVEPAGYATEWGSTSAVTVPRLPAYDDFRADLPIAASTKRADPSATRPAILEVVDADEPPLRIFFGKGPLPLMQKEYAARLAEWERWDGVSRAAHGD
jgi:NAD(P)-dependent dehydrogenase (short-subunit alcohol dehydrogenase family)